MPGGAGVPNIPGPAPAPAPTPSPAQSPTGGGPSPSSGAAGAAAQENLIACINGPDLYDVYNPDMSLVGKAVLNPSASYPNAQISFPKGPPCPVPQATGAGGLCDVPARYLAPKDPSGRQGDPVLVCYIKDHGMTLIDYVTGAPIGTHLSGACLSLLSNATIAQEGDPRCAGLTGSATPRPTPPQPITPPTSTPPATTPTSGPLPTQPITAPPAVTPPSGGGMPTQPITAPGAPGASPWPAYGAPIGVSAPAYGDGGGNSMIQAQSMQAPPLMPSQKPMACANTLIPKQMDQWFEECPGVKKARGY